MRVAGFLRSPVFRWGVFSGLVLVALLLQLVLDPWRAFLPSAESGFGLREYRDNGLLLAAVFGAPIVGLLVLTWPFWVPFFGRTPQQADHRKPRSTWLWLSPALAALLLLGLATPRLDFSFWEDEDVAVRKFIAGEYKSEKDGTFRVDPVSWDEALFGYWRPTNHVPQSALSKASHAVWTAWNPEADFAFSEPAIRFPALVFGVATLFVVFFLVRETGFSLAAAAVPFLFALHPWLIRFSSEARGYSLAFAALVLAFALAIVMVRRRSLMATLFFAISSAIAVWAYPGLLIGLAFAWLAVAGWLLFARPVDWDLIGVRLLVMSAGVGVAFLPLAMPLAPQFLEYTRSDSQMGEMGVNWLGHAMSYNLVGAPRVVGDPSDPTLPQLAAATARFGQVAHAAFWSFCALGLVGVAALARRTPLALLMLAGLVAGAGLTYWDAENSGFRLHEWYIYYLMLPVLVLPAIGVEGLARLIPGPAVQRTAAAVLLVLLIGGYALATSPTRDAALSRPHMPMRNLYEQARGTLDPNAPDQDAILTVATEPTPRLYDPRVSTVKTAADLGESIAKLEPNGELFLIVRFRAIGDAEYREVTEAATSGAEFELVREFEAAFPFEKRYLYRYRATPPRQETQ